MVETEWKDRYLVTGDYKQKGGPLECGNYGGIKLMEHLMKTLERKHVLRQMQEKPLINRRTFICFSRPGKII